jgi:hypothetical protein
MILTFNTSDNANVIIMAVQKAAYGIDLSSATRVFFVSPVWQTAMEQQAIKRAHRIGQTKPVFIETLVIRNTIEDELLKRRDQVSNGDGMYIHIEVIFTQIINECNTVVEEDKENLKRGYFFADSKLRSILNHAHFVPLPDTIYKNEETGEYQQKIISLDAPLDFVPKKPVIVKTKELVKDYINETEAPFTLPMQISSPSLASISDQYCNTSDINVDATDDEDEEPPQTQHRIFTGASKLYDVLGQSISSNSSKNQDSDDDMLLDIEGDEDVMDHIQPWKIRMMDEQKRSQDKKKPASIIQPSTKKRKPSPPPPPPPPPSSSSVGTTAINLLPLPLPPTSLPPLPSQQQQQQQDNDEKGNPKKKKKTVRFA